MTTDISAASAASLQSTERFSRRAEAYLRARPRYPDKMATYLESAVGLNRQWVVADIGAGPGFLGEVFLRYGATVFAVEPNDDMRRIARQHLAQYEKATVVTASAEDSGLPTASVDLIVAGSALHWFDLARAREEFRRILKPDGIVLIASNRRGQDDTPFMREYRETLRRYQRADRASAARSDKRALAAKLFDGASFREHYIDNPQALRSAEALIDRAVSMSSSPLPGSPHFDAMAAELRALFQRHANDGSVVNASETRIIYGRLSPPGSHRS